MGTKAMLNFTTLTSSSRTYPYVVVILFAVFSAYIPFTGFPCREALAIYSDDQGWQRQQIHNHDIQQVQKLIPEYHAVQELSQEKGIADHERFAERIQAISDVKTENNVQSSHSYDLASESIVLLRQLQLNPRDYAQCQGNPLRQLVHGECIKLLEWNDYIDPLYKAMEKADFSGRNIVKRATAFAVHWKAQDKLIRGLQGVVDTAQKRVIKWCANNPFKNAEDILVTTPEGIIVRAAAGEHDSNMLFSKSKSKTGGSNSSTKGATGLREAVKKLGWTTNDYRHFPQKNWTWKEIVEYTRHGKAKYRPGIDIESLERYAWENGTPIANRNKNYKVFEAGQIIGANSGKETCYMRIEYNGEVIHGHPILEHEYKQYLKQK